MEALQHEYAEMMVLAGVSPVKGPGVVVEVADAEKAAITGAVEDSIVHYDDLLKVINELFAGGAEAVSINGQRLVSTSEIRCVGPVIMVNGVRTTSPFTILAIGEPQTLKKALEMPGGIFDLLSIWNLQLKCMVQEQAY